jgi:TetR/AcrR family transcriptional regulator
MPRAASSASKPPPSGPRRRAARGRSGQLADQANATRERILEAALQVFAEHGFDGATTREIGARAGINHAMIGYHFKGKDALWRAAVGGMFERLDTELNDPELPALDLNSRVGLRDFILRYVRYCARHPEHARIMVQESVRGGPRLDWAVETYIRPSHQRFSPRLDARESEGVLPDIGRVSLSYILIAACQIPFMLTAEIRTLYGVDMGQPEAVEAHAEAVAAVFLGPALLQPSMPTLTNRAKETATAHRKPNS